MPYFFYILRCADNSLYSGITTDLIKRVKEHNSKNPRGSKSLRGKLPAILIYFEKYKNRSTATKRELEVKKWSKSRKELLVKGLLK